MQTLKFGTSRYTLAPTRNVGELQSKFAKCTGKFKPSPIGKERRGYPQFTPGMSTADYVKAFYAFNGLSGARQLFAPLNAEPCALYTGEDSHEIIGDEPADLAEARTGAPEPAATVANDPAAPVDPVDPAPAATGPDVDPEALELAAGAILARALLQRFGVSDPAAVPAANSAELETMRAAAGAEALARFAPAAPVPAAPAAAPGPCWMSDAARRVYAVHVETAKHARAINPEFRGMLRRPRSAGFVADYLAPDVRAHRRAIAAAVRADRAARRVPIAPAPAAPVPGESAPVDRRAAYDLATRAAAIELERITCSLAADGERRRVIDAGRRGAIGARADVVRMLERFATGGRGDIGAENARRTLAELAQSEGGPVPVNPAPAAFTPDPAEVSRVARVAVGPFDAPADVAADLRERSARLKSAPVNLAAGEEFGWTVHRMGCETAATWRAAADAIDAAASEPAAHYLAGAARADAAGNTRRAEVLRELAAEAPPVATHSAPDPVPGKPEAATIPRGMESHRRDACTFKALRLGDAFQFDAGGPVFVRARGGFRPGCGGHLHACAPHTPVIRYGAPAAQPVDVEALRADLRRIETAILLGAPSRFAAGGGDIEAACEHRSASPRLKRERAALRERIRAAAPLPSESAPLPAESPRAQTWQPSARLLAALDAAPTVDLFDYLADHAAELRGATHAELRAAVLADIERTGEAVYWARVEPTPFEAWPDEPTDPKPKFGPYRYAQRTGRTVVAYCDGGRGGIYAQRFGMRYVGRARGYVGTVKQADKLCAAWLADAIRNAERARLAPVPSETRAELAERARASVAGPTPSLRIPADDLRARVPRRFAPVYILQA